MNALSLAGKGVTPQSSRAARLADFQLVFNVKHWFPHEGGVGNVVPHDGSHVWGVVHELVPEDLTALDKLESYGVGYDRIEVELDVAGHTERAVTYVGLPDFLDDSRLPTSRYMNIILAGARQAKLPKDYVERLSQTALFVPPNYPPFSPKPGKNWPILGLNNLANEPGFTGLWGHVFDMSEAAPHLQHLRDIFGGKDMTLFFLKRHDQSSGNETWDDIYTGNLSVPLRIYLNAYLHNFDQLFRYVGSLRYL